MHNDIESFKAKQTNSVSKYHGFVERINNVSSSAGTGVNIYKIKCF